MRNGVLACLTSRFRLTQGTSGISPGRCARLYDLTDAYNSYANFMFKLDTQHSEATDIYMHLRLGSIFMRDYGESALWKQWGIPGYASKSGGTHMLSRAEWLDLSALFVVDVWFWKRTNDAMNDTGYIPRLSEFITLIR
jgi:hypothetical protein